MKFRAGFVSNSSSSSFSIFGVETNWDELTRVFFPEFVAEGPKQVPNCTHTFERATMKFCPHCGREAWRTTSPTSVDYEDMEEAITKEGLVLIHDDYCCYIGENLKGRGGKRAALKRLEEMKALAEKLEKMFGREADFITGEVAC